MTNESAKRVPSSRLPPPLEVVRALEAMRARDVVRSLRKAFAVPRKRSSNGQEYGRWFSAETLRLMSAHLKAVDRELRRNRSPART